MKSSYLITGDLPWEALQEEFRKERKEEKKVWTKLIFSITQLSTLILQSLLVLGPRI